MLSSAKLISVVAPVFDEEESVVEFYRRVKAALDKVNHSYELLIVDDGSTDGTFDKLRAIAAADPAIKVIRFSRNFGHQAAITAGLDAASGDAVIMMDADLQHPPELLPNLIALWEQGNDVVYTVRENTEGAGRFKNWSSCLFYRLINRISNIGITENAADFRLLDRRVVESLKLLRERARFMRGLINWVGYKQAGVPFVAQKRFAGKSKFSLKKMVRFALDCVVSFSLFPLHAAVYAGFLISLFSFLYAGYAIYMRLFTNQTISGWASLLVAVLFLGGIQLIFLGVIGEYVGRIFEEAKRRPLYLVQDVLNLDRRTIDREIS